MAAEEKREEVKHPNRRSNQPGKKKEGGFDAPEANEKGG